MDDRMTHTLTLEAAVGSGRTERPRGPFEVNEPLPKPVLLWRDRTNKAANKPQELLHFGWQRNSAQRILI
jgi:hypothetical protein